MKFCLEKVKLVFGIDLRTLALFRICLGALLLFDLANKAPHITAFYSDKGIMPRTVAMESVWPSQLSFHFMNGSTTAMALMFVLAALCALALLVGYRTRWMVILSWLLYMSLCYRNNMILQAGDQLLGGMLFWAMFLPLNARFSVDAALDETPEKHSENHYFSMATMALLLQAIYVYVFGALLKTSPQWIPEGTAVYYALHLDSIASPFAIWIREFPDLLKSLTHYVWGLELIAPLLMFCPVFYVPLRLITQFLLITMHLGFSLCLKIGMFAYISITSLILFTPGWVWDKFTSRARTEKRRKIRLYYDQDCSFCKKTCLIFREFFLLADTPLIAAQSDPEIHAIMEEHNSWVVMDHDDTPHVCWEAVNFVIRSSPIFWPLGWLMSLSLFRRPQRWLYRKIADNRPALGNFSTLFLPYRKIRLKASLLGSAIVTVLMAGVFYLNLSHLEQVDVPTPHSLNLATAALNLHQRWSMFAPNPAKVDGWYVIKGWLKDGRTADLYTMRLGKTTFDKPASLSDYYGNYRWRKYFENIAQRKNHGYRLHYGRYLCYKWNALYGQQAHLKNLTIYFNQETTQPNYQPQLLERYKLLEYTCPEV